jgi:hypothetical protein
VNDLKWGRRPAGGEGRELRSPDGDEMWLQPAADEKLRPHDSVSLTKRRRRLAQAWWVGQRTAADSWDMSLLGGGRGWHTQTLVGGGGEKNSDVFACDGRSRGAAHGAVKFVTFVGLLSTHGNYSNFRRLFSLV